MDNKGSQVNIKKVICDFFGPGNIVGKTRFLCPIYTISMCAILSHPIAEKLELKKH